jgi:hypothetical protein
MPTTLLHEPAAIAGKAKRMIDRLKGHYDLGKQLRSRANALSTEQFAKKAKVNIRTMRNFGAFAKHYTPAEFRQLRKLRRRGSDLPLHWGYIPHLLAVETKGGKAAREKFQKLAATKGWTVPELQLAIQQEYPRQPGHGRTMKRPSSPLAGLEQLAFGAEGFVRRCRHIVDHLEQISPERRGKATRSRAREVAAMLDQAAKTARSAAGRLRRL